jgi:hypothetical protein
VPKSAPGHANKCFEQVFEQAIYRADFFAQIFSNRNFQPDFSTGFFLTGFSNRNYCKGLLPRLALQLR